VRIYHPWYAHHPEFIEEGIGVELDPDARYLDYFVERWDDGLDFLNVEHDVVARSPDDVAEMKACPEPWCVAPYSKDYEYWEPLLGFTRFRRRHIMATRHVWTDYRRFLDGGPTLVWRWQGHGVPVWSQLDFAHHAYASALGLHPHRHAPVVHAK
jgi:hypothetical protein